MRRAIIATVGTVAALVAVLEYKSSGTVKSVQVSVPAGPTAKSVSSSTTAPTTTAATPPTTAPSSTTAPGSTPTPTSTPASSTTTSASPSGSFTGTEVSYQYGNIEVEITVKAGKVTDIAVPVNSADDPRSASINSQAVPILTREALAAQSVHFDVVSGATYTSDAFARALQTALSKAGK